MHFFKIISFIILFLVSCSVAKEIAVVQKQVIKPIPTQKLEALVLKIGTPIYIRIFKKEKKLELWAKVDKKFKLYKTYRICTFSGELGPKLKQGDNQSPGGVYTIKQEQLKPNSKYHLGLVLDFPNRYDRYQKRTGTYLMIHGKCSSTGCYAMGNMQIEEIYKMAEDALNNGQKKTFEYNINWFNGILGRFLYPGKTKLEKCYYHIGGHAAGRPPGMLRVSIEYFAAQLILAFQ